MNFHSWFLIKFMIFAIKVKINLEYGFFLKKNNPEPI